MTYALDHSQRELHMHGPNDRLAAVPVFDRLQYFYGQLLGAGDLKAEQSFFREKLKLHNRCLHGYGVVCGLEVTLERDPVPCEPAEPPQPPYPPPPSEDPKVREIQQQIRQLRQEATATEDPDKRRAIEARIAELEKQSRDLPGAPAPAPAPEPRRPAKLVIHPGLALDCHGNEIVVRQAYRMDAVRRLSPPERRRLEEEPDAPLYVSICFEEQGVEPTRPALSDACGAVGACEFGKLRDCFCVEVSLQRPAADERCDTCCTGCDDDCLLLARVAKERVDNGVRREIGTHVPAAISGVSWAHGARYTPQEAARILGARQGDKGLEIRFTRPVHGDTLADPVLTVSVTERGRGRAANIYELQGEFVGLPRDELVTSLRYRQTSEESLNNGDLVLITLRTPMVLDGCCRPVEGLNAGGRVPLLHDYQHNRRGGEGPEHCRRPSFKAGEWTTHGDGNFESWFSISTDMGAS